MKTFLHSLLLTGLALAVIPGTGWSKPAPFPESIDAEDQTLTLLGTGLLRYKRIIPVYDAALYLGQGAAQDKVLQDIPKRLEVVYRVNAEAARFHKAGEQVLEKNYSSTEIGAIRERLDLMNSWYPDARKGDRCAIQYVPGQGTELIYNNQSLGIIPGEDFARLYFSIWLGDQPASKALRDDLLRRK